MGDGADMALDEMEDNEDQIVQFKTGLMTKEEVYQLGIIDELGFETDFKHTLNERR
jgi:hypothetical protein